MDLPADLRPAFVAQDEALRQFTLLKESVAWCEEWLTLFGRRHRVPRLVAAYGDAGVSYRYSGQLHAARPWLPELADLRLRLQHALDTPFNFVLLNRYRTGADGMGWHSDDEPELSGLIASLSLGGTRRFVVRCRHDRRRRWQMDLASGDLLTMSVASQRHYQHALPKTRRPVAERINLTFRQVVPTSNARRPA